MPENILIAIAWPYSNAEIHVGNITGSHLPGDIVARYHRLKGNNVLVVSGTDAHGTPVVLAADKEGKPVEEVYKKYHDSFIEVFKGFGITYDMFTTTHSENHFKVSQAMFLALQKNGLSFQAVQQAMVLPQRRQVPAGPLRRRDVLHLRLRRRALRPV
jgi:methionyl-tRNA synthetase